MNQKAMPELGRRIQLFQETKPELSTRFQAATLKNTTAAARTNQPFATTPARAKEADAFRGLLRTVLSKYARGYQDDSGPTPLPRRLASTSPASPGLPHLPRCLASTPPASSAPSGFRAARAVRSRALPRARLSHTPPTRPHGRPRSLACGTTTPYATTFLA